MINRINIVEETDDDPPWIRRRVIGWFDPTRAERFTEQTDWNGSNNISRATGSQWTHEALWRTSGGRWVLNWWSMWQQQNSELAETYRYLEADEALAWLRLNEHYNIITQLWGEDPPEGRLTTEKETERA